LSDKRTIRFSRIRKGLAREKHAARPFAFVVPKQEGWEKRGSIFNEGQAHLLGLFGVIKSMNVAPAHFGREAASPSRQHRDAELRVGKRREFPKQREKEARRCSFVEE